MIKGLITALSQELELSAKEIADTIWLALQITSDSPDSQTAKDEPFQKPLTNSDSPKTPLINNDSTPPPLEREESDRQTINQPLESQKAGIYARSEQQTSKTSGLSLKVPDASSLREPLILARALKPLMRRIASGRELVLDEAATTQQIADKGIWIPVLKPTLEPWLDLELVVDESISMQIWRHTIKELERLLKNYGIFRDVRVWGLITDAKEQIQIRRGIGAMAKNQSPRSPKELIDPSGRRLVLVVSDCVSSLWRSGKVTPVLEMWAKQGSMAIVQMLPKWMWERTALGKASEVRLRGLKPGEFNQNLIAQEVSLWDELDNEREVKVPVFTLEPDRAAIWALMLSGKGSIWTSGYVFKLEEIPVENESIEAIVAKKEKLDAPNRVQGFRMTASPMARRLAGLLASAPVITLPIVRLIQETLLKDSLQVNVAEVFLGGLLKPLSEINAETNPDYVQYGFMEGVRELLLDSVPSNYVLNVIDGVSKYVAKKMGLSVADFAAVLKNEQPARNSQMAEEVGYFATATAQVLRGLGGEYAKFADSLSNKISVDTNEHLNKANIGLIYERQGNVAKAIENYLLAIKIKEETQLHVKVQKLINIFAGEQVDIYENLVNLLWDSGEYEKAFNYSELARSNSWLNQLINRPKDFYIGVNSELLTQEQELKIKVATLRTQKDKTQNWDEKKKLSRELQKLEAEYSELLLIHHSETTSPVRINPASLSDISQSLDSNTTLISYFVTEKRTLAFIITRDRFKSVALEVSEKLLTRKIKAISIFESLDNPHPPCLQELYRWLIVPLKDHIKTNCLAIALHGVLHYLPFAALTDGQKYLIDRYQISTLPNASFLCFLPAKHSAISNTLLALGNPITPERLNKLQYAQEEVETIAKLYGTKALIGAEATKTALIQQAAQAGIIHIAAHAKYERRNPLFSTIYLAKDAINDGYLKAYEIYQLNLRLSTSLVVLSASQSQRGETSQGDKTVSLNRAFLYSGTPTTIASLWSINDRSTSVLMKHFYAYLQSGHTKAGALQQAQIQARKEYPHPYYWAGFVLTGDGGKV